MIRLTVTLIVAIYIILIVVPGPDHGVGVAVRNDAGQNWLVSLVTDAEINAQTPRRAPPSARTVQGDPLDRLTRTETGFLLHSADGERIEISAIIDPVALLAEAQAGGDTIARVSVVEPAAARPEEAVPVADTPTTNPNPGPAPSAPVWRVAGESVNFRAGPSTDTAVLTALVRGDEVIYLADAADDWAYLRVVSSGLEGYMAARFLEPVN